MAIAVERTMCEFTRKWPRCSRATDCRAPSLNGFTPLPQTSRRPNWSKESYICHPPRILSNMDDRTCDRSPGWARYRCATRLAYDGSDNVTLRLDYENEVQPDALLRLDPTLGGRSSVSDDDYLEGPPELIVEIAASSASYDMNQKRRVYARTGVPEYVVLLTYEERVVWFVLREGVYEEMQPDADGILRSEIFPGLWLDAAALIGGDLSQVLAVLQQGIDSDEHKAYVAKLHD